LTGCPHVQGELYQGMLCHTILSDITDAYEWSFVAVRHLKNKKLQANCNLRKIRKQFGQRNHRRTAQRQRAKRICRTVRNYFF
jgi:hypothetical protein